jgi:hypothetical protein
MLRREFMTLVAAQGLVAAHAQSPAGGSTGLIAPSYESTLNTIR